MSIIWIISPTLKKKYYNFQINFLQDVCLKHKGKTKVSKNIKKSTGCFLGAPEGGVLRGLRKGNQSEQREYSKRGPVGERW